MITVALPIEFGCKGFVTTVDVIYSRRCSSETNKLRDVHSIGGTSRDIAVENGKLTISKSKSSPLS